MRGGGLSRVVHEMGNLKGVQKVRETKKQSVRNGGGLLAILGGSESDSGFGCGVKFTKADRGWRGRRSNTGEDRLPKTQKANPPPTPKERHRKS